jgi:hypothetical protein
MPEKLQPTYVPFLDKLLGGGTATEGVYGILGPTGIGKTHLATMVACDGATCGSVFQETYGKPRPWLLFDLESPEDMSKMRILSHCAKVRRDNVFVGNVTEQPYELERKTEFMKWTESIKTEQYRLNYTKHTLDKNFKFFNADRLRKVLSGDSGFPRFPFDLVEAISLCTKNIQNSFQEQPGGIVIDGVKNIWPYVEDLLPLDEREFIKYFVRVFCRGLAEQYHCPVWVTHQVNGTACAASSLALLSHSNAACCKSFADSLDSCFVLGNFTERNHFAIQCTKGNPDRAMLDQLVLTHDEDFSSITEVTNAQKNRRRGDWDVPHTNASTTNTHEVQFIDQLIADLR